MPGLFGGSPKIETSTAKFKGAGTGSLQLRDLPFQERLERGLAAGTTRKGFPRFFLDRTGPVFGLPQEQALQTNLAGLQSNVAGLRSSLAPLRSDAQSLQSLFPGLRASSAALGQQVQGLLGQVQPGFGRLTESLVEGVRQREAASVGNLRSALAKRNVLGSSFAQRELQRTGLDFQQEEDRVRSQAFAQELAASQGLIQQAGQLLELDASLIGQEAQNLGFQLGLTQAESQIFAQELSVIQQQQSLLAQAVQRELQELGLTVGAASNTQQIVSQIGQSNAQLAAAHAAGQGQLAGSLVGLGVGAAFTPLEGTFAGSLLG